MENNTVCRIIIKLMGHKWKLMGHFKFSYCLIFAIGIK